MRLSVAALLSVLMLGAPAAAWAGDDAYAVQRGRMVAEVRAMAAGVEGRGRTISARVYEALGRAPRHLFVPEALRGRAYLNAPLAIGADQTISQPYIVALMTDLVDAKPGARLLEVGTGSGYQAAMLAEMMGDGGAGIFTIEIVPALAARAKAALAAAGYTGVATRTGDGYAGWPAAAPFDGILVTAAPDHVPPPLLDQLKPGGRMVVPVGPNGGAQSLLLLTKRPDGTIARRTILPVAFVPMTGTKGK